MPYVLKDELREFIQEVSKLLGNGFEKAILYGSYARGDYNENSDIDIMILVNLSDKQILQYENQIFDLAFEIEMNTVIDISPIIKNESEYEYWLDTLPFYKNISDEGVLLRR